jgi:hypothetical protein
MHTSTMIDLLEFVGKKVEIELRDGQVYTGYTLWEDLINSDPIYKYSIEPLSYKYDKYGNYGKLCNDLDIIKIEEIKPMNKYEELEKKVAEMQKEIDYLKKEEIVHPKIKSVRVTRTIEYSPECYLDYCRRNEVVPSQEDFIAFLTECLYDDFHRVPIFEQKIEEIDD